MIYVFGIIVLIIFIICVIMFFNISRLKELHNSLLICEDTINDLLKSKLDIVTELLKDIKDTKIKKKFNYDNELSMYDKEAMLFDVGWNINKYVKDNKKTELKDKVRELNFLEESLDGLKDYYNANVLSYNEIFLKPIFNKIFRLLKFSDFKTFRIRKLEEYEIFKN